MLCDGNSLVTQCVPNALLHMSVSVLRKVFGTVLLKDVMRLTVDRSSLASVHAASELFSSMYWYRTSGSVVVTTPESIKCIALQYVEVLLVERQVP